MSSYMAGRVWLELSALRSTEKKCAAEVERVVGELTRLQTEADRYAQRQSELQSVAHSKIEQYRQVAQKRVAERQEEKEVERLRNQNAPEPEKVETETSALLHSVLQFAATSTDVPKKQKSANGKNKLMKAFSIVQQQQAQEQETEDVGTAWLIFEECIVSLTAIDNSNVSISAKELLQQAKNCSPIARQSFMNENETLLADLEAQAAAAMARREEQRAEYKKYLALCRLLSVAEDGTAEHDEQLCQSFVHQLEQQFLRQTGQEYISTVLSQTFAKYGLHLAQSADSKDGSESQLYRFSESAVLSVEKRGGAFEMEIKGLSSGNEPSLDERRTVEKEAVKFCSLFPRIAADLAQNGIKISNDFTEEPNGESLNFMARDEAVNIVPVQEMEMYLGG